MALTKVKGSVWDSDNNNLSANVKDFGATGDGATDDTAAIQLALDSTATDIYFPEGTYVCENPLGVANSTAVLISTIANRTLRGPGILTALTQVKKLLQIGGASTTVSLHVDGNDFIGYAVVVVAADSVVSDCLIYDLNGFTDWGAIAVHIDLDGIDAGAVVRDNVIKNIQAVGDGTGGNGVGMCRAVLVQSDTAQKSQVTITGNYIEQVQGEEGDCIVIAGGTTATPLTIPVLISNNAVRTWNRRAIKIACNGVTVANNYLYNPLPGTLGTLQRVIDVTAGNNITITGNVLEQCYYQAQIVLYANSPQTSDNITISNNTISDIGTTAGANALINCRTYGNNVVIQNNTINCPTHADEAIHVTETTGVLIAGNTIATNDSTWHLFTNCTGVRMAGNIFNGDAGYQSFYDITTNAHVIDVTGGGRAVVLRNRDTMLSNGERISSIQCEQNDASAPATVMASVNFVAVGSGGSTSMTLNTGSTSLPDVTAVTIGTAGTVDFVNTLSSDLTTDDKPFINYKATADGDTTSALSTLQTPSGTKTHIQVDINGVKHWITAWPALA